MLSEQQFAAGSFARNIAAVPNILWMMTQTSH